MEVFDEVKQRIGGINFQNNTRLGAPFVTRRRNCEAGVENAPADRLV